MASDTRGLANNAIQSSENTPNVEQTYAAAAALAFSPPTKDQAIIVESIECIENSTIDDYLDALEEILNLSKVKFISKISGACVCVYLDSKQTVEKLLSLKLKVNHHLLPIRPLLEKNKRVVISNVSPSIPHDIVIQALTNKGITPVYKMYHIKASSSKPGRSHIMSFRRQVYIKEEEQHLLPKSLQIVYEEITHWIYLSTETAHCFLCKEHGHIAKVCPQNLTHVSSESNTRINNQDSAELRTDNTIAKRPAPDSTTSEDTNWPLIQQEHTQADRSFKKPSHKKRRTTEEETLKIQKNTKESLALLKETIENYSVDNRKLPLDFRFSSFLSETYGQSDILNIARSTRTIQKASLGCLIWRTRVCSKQT